MPQAQGHQRADDPTDLPGWCAAVRVRVRSDDLDFNEVFFNDVRVPAENLVGR
jgi:alkylation response protein AidB-like acyl-CoA dehydrogenase